MTIFGLSDGALRFSIFVSIFVIMALLEAWLPRRERRFKRVQRWRTNFGVLFADYLAIAAVTLVIPVTALITAFWATSNGWGLFNLVDLPIWLEWIIAFAVLDFVIWGQHVITHKIPLLWRLHRVHHSDEDLDASSAVRFHPLEIVFSIFVKSLAVLLLGAPAALVVLFEIVLNGSALFNHANFKLPLVLDKVLRLIIVTPDMHRVHHSTINKETDSNYGFALSIWDHMFGTYIDQPEKGHKGMVVGLSQWQDEAPTKLGWTLLLPFVNPPRSKPSVKTDREPS